VLLVAAYLLQIKRGAATTALEPLLFAVKVYCSLSLSLALSLFAFLSHWMVNVVASVLSLARFFAFCHAPHCHIDKKVTFANHDWSYQNPKPNVK